MIHVAVENLEQDEIEEIRNALRSVTNKDIVVSDASVSLAEVPALDEYADELAQRVVDEMEGR